MTKRLKDLIDYQKDAVVSKTLISKKTGTVTLFAFDKGQELSEHKAPFDALVYLLEGEAEIMVSNKLHNLKEEEIIIIPANELHSVKAIQRFKMLLIMIKD